MNKYFIFLLLALIVVKLVDLEEIAQHSQSFAIAVTIFMICVPIFSLSMILLKLIKMKNETTLIMKNKIKQK
tara:strand:- start:683 stop:898 length:216 start_codon:yes stop_codon:yes gene_type:complete